MSLSQLDRFVDVKGGQLFVRSWQPATLQNNTALILLHDSLGSVELWRDFPEKLAQALNHTVIAYDRLGYGRSAARAQLPSLNFIQEETETYLPAVLKALNIEDFILLGHSIGGILSLTAASHLRHCKAVISEAAPAFIEQRTLDGIRAAKTLFGDPEQFARLKRWHGEKAQWVLDTWTEIWLSPQFASWSLEPVLPQVTCPVLVIHGDQDEYGSTRLPEFISGRVSGPVNMHILEGCGHIPHREMPDAILELISGFIR